MVVNAVAGNWRYSRIVAHESVAPVVGDMTSKRAVWLGWGNAFLTRTEVDHRIWQERGGGITKKGSVRSEKEIEAFAAVAIHPLWSGSPG